MKFHMLIALSGILLVTSGCGGKSGNAPDVARVEGTVTLDGAPLEGATVEFQPVAGGRPSVGTSDANGHYSLTYSNDLAGAIIGEHNVSIKTFTYARPDVPEKLPAKYHSPTTLKETVQPEKNQIDFELNSK